MNPNPKIELEEMSNESLTGLLSHIKARLFILRYSASTTSTELEELDRLLPVVRLEIRNRKLSGKMSNTV